MSRIFLSHSSAEQRRGHRAARLAGRPQGWDDLFLDLDPERGIAAGERWEAALNEAANRCEAVLFLVSPAWLASSWCLAEFQLAHGTQQALFGVLIEELTGAELPVELTGDVADRQSGGGHATTSRT